MEAHALKLGSTIAKRAATSWLQRRKAEFERGASLAELAQAELKGPLQQRKLENLVDRIGAQVAEQLAPVLQQRFGDVPDNEAEAAILGVVDLLDQVDLSDKALLSADADPEVLAKRIRAQFPQRGTDLIPRARELHELAMDQACRHLVQVVRYLPSFQPAALADVLARLTSQSEQLELLLSRVPTTSLYAPQGVDRDEEFRTEYLSHLAKTLDQLKLLGLPGDDLPTLKLTVAYLSLSVSGSREKGQRRPENWFDPQMSSDAEGVSVEAAIGSGERILLRGDAGSGKTTLLDWLAVRAARGDLDDKLAAWNGCVPFVIRLRTFADGHLPAPERFVSEGTPMIANLMPDGWSHRLLRAGRAMVLVDGVDEVPASRRRDVKTWLHDLLTAFPAARVVVTSRTAAVADARWLAEDEFDAVTLEPMTPSNILDFVQRWHQAAELSGAEVGGAEDRLRSQLERSHLRQLAATPLLCAMLCALNLVHRSELPRNRMDLYAKALSMLLHMRDAERGIPAPMGDTEKRVLLRDLAWRLTLANKVEFTTDEARSHIARKLPGMPNIAAGDPDRILKHLLERSGVLREPVPGRVDFVHRTFLEYLAADEAIQQHHVDTLIAHAHLDTWWETVVMACGHATTTQVGQLLTGILDRAEQEKRKARHLRLLAAACLETIRDVAPETSARVDAVIRDKLVPPRSMAETNSLMAVGHRVLRYLPSTLDGMSGARAAATVRAAALAGTSDALPLLASYAQDPRREVHRELELAWRYFDPERFAQVVLANSPLNKGQLTVWWSKHLPYVKHLSQLANLDVILDHETIDSLDRLTGLPALRILRATLLPSAPHDLRLLSEYQEIRTLQLAGLDLTADLSPLAELRSLLGVMLDGYRDEALAGTPELDGMSSLILFRPLGNSTLEQAVRVFRSIKVLVVSRFELLDIEQVARMSSVKELTIFNSGFDSLRPLVGMAELKDLAIFENVHFDYDLSPLADLDLQSVTLDSSVSYTGVDSLKCAVRYR